MIKLSVKSEKHLALHFGDSKSAGSFFFTEVFANPSELLQYINGCEPSETIAQTGDREALIFHMAEAVGNSGIILRSQVLPENIIVENRNGFQMEVAVLQELQLAYEFCVIVEKINGESVIITAFPGAYSLSFPYEGQEKEEFEKSTLFWQEYILCRKA
jgi:predicted nucleic acid-binding protein